jgi:putative hydrolase of the HAD superfamily
MHKAILFDLGKVLVNFDFRRAYAQLEPLCGYEMAEIRRRLAATGLVERLETGLIEPRDFVPPVCEALGIPADYDGFRRIFNCIFDETLIPEELLERLAKRYRMVLVSNTNAMHFEILRQNYGHMLRHFHRLILSHEVRAMKPNPAIYQAAVEAAGCRPEECFYTDDIAVFVEAARNLGIDAVLFESREQLERELGLRGMLAE